MLPESIGRFLEEEEFRKLSSKLEDAMASDYIYSRNKAEIIHIMAELVETVYIRGRLDERYHLIGPRKTLYEKSE